jgi:hypothetical protein
MTVSLIHPRLVFLSKPRCLNCRMKAPKLLHLGKPGCLAVGQKLETIDEVIVEKNWDPGNFSLGFNVLNFLEL